MVKSFPHALLLSPRFVNEKRTDMELNPGGYFNMPGVIVDLQQIPALLSMSHENFTVV